VDPLIEALEAYHVGKWKSAVEKMLTFLETNYEVVFGLILDN
jgi:hypothetical protein